MTSDATQAAVRDGVTGPLELGPESWGPGNKPDPFIGHEQRWTGTPLSRLDGPPKVRGRAPFAAEFVLDDMLYASLVFSTIARGRIVALDTAAAARAPGVELVMDHRNAPLLQRIPLDEAPDSAAVGDDLPIMQDDEVHWNGQPIALVLAATQEQADHAASLVRATYDTQPAVVDLAQAKLEGTDPGTVFGQPLRVDVGDAEAALAAAPVSVDAVYRTPHMNHSAIELHAATLAWNDGVLHVHDSTQAVSHTVEELAQVFDIPPERVRVTSPYVGGGFGGKQLWRHQVLAAAAAQLVRRPVRIMLSRQGVFRAVGGRAATEQRVAIGAERDGRFTAIIHTGTSTTSRHCRTAEPFSMVSQCSYAADTFALDGRLAYLDMMANCTMRAPGGAVGNFALECAVDELAVALDMDPVELRIRNDPQTEPATGRTISSRHTVEVWRAGAQRFGWSARNPVPGAVRDGEWLVGLGCGGATHPYVRQPGAAASMTLTRDGHVTVDIAAHEMGMGTATVQTQVIADRLALEPDRISFGYGDSAMPGMVMAAGSHQSAAIGAAVVAASRELVAQLLTLVGHDSPLHGLEPAEVGTFDGGLARLGHAEQHESYASILSRGGRDQVSVTVKSPPPEEMMTWSMHSFGAMFAQVRVNEVTGEVRVDRFLASMDCGRILNPKTATSQFRGGVIMGLGLALMEETVYDERTGRVVNRSLADYHVPAHLDVPRIDVIWNDIPDPHAPMGARGIGEIGITGAGAAVANAIYNATGKRIRDLPITLDKLL